MTARGSTFDIDALGTEMIDALRASLADRAPKLQSVVELELRRLAGALADVGSLFARGEIDQERARQLVNIYQLSVRSVLRTVEGLTMLATERTMQSVMHVAGAVLNRVLEFQLIPNVPTSSFKAGKDL